MEALAVERPHTPSIKPHGEKAHEAGFFFFFLPSGIWST
jgi:hypothetical protein